MIWFWFSQMQTPGNVLAFVFYYKHNLRNLTTHNSVTRSMSIITNVVPDRLSQFKQLIRHVHDEPTLLRKALRIASKELSNDDIIKLRNWAIARFPL